ncbi:MAG: hypothetical protein ACR2P1_22750 [Pseudomonadales bacterium]
MCLLTYQQINDLATIVIKEHGSSLADDQLTESIYLLLEEIAGFEQCHSGADDESDHVVQQIKRRYDEQNCREN